MIFAFLTFLSAFFIEFIGSWTSIIGLSSMFSANPIIIILAIALDVGKLVCVSFLYTYWHKINLAMKSYMLVASAILMIITSAGAAGYLSSQFQGAILNTKESEIVVKSMTDEKARLEVRKKEIDTQVANLPPEMVKGRTRLIAQFKDELDRTNKRIFEIDTEMPKLQVKQANVEAHAGPILYIAKAFDTTVEQAVKWVILMIIFVFDPLAIALIIAGNFLVRQRKLELAEEQKNKKLAEDEERHRQQNIELEGIKHLREIEEVVNPGHCIVEAGTFAKVTVDPEGLITNVNVPKIVEEPIASEEVPLSADVVATNVEIVEAIKSITNVQYIYKPKIVRAEPVVDHFPEAVYAVIDDHEDEPDPGIESDDQLNTLVIPMVEPTPEESEVTEEAPDEILISKAFDDIKHIPGDENLAVTSTEFWPSSSTKTVVYKNL